MDERQLKTNFLIELNELLTKYDAWLCVDFPDTPDEVPEEIIAFIDDDPFVQSALPYGIEVRLGRKLEPMFDINEILDR